MSDSLRPHGLQHARFPCPSLHFMVMPSNHLILCWPLLILPSIFPSIKVYSNESALHIRWPKYWSFSFSIISSNDYSGLISFGVDWFYLLAVQGTLKSFLQHHSLKISIIQLSAFFTVQLSHLYMTIGKTIALTISTFIDKVMSLFCCCCCCCYSLLKDNCFTEFCCFLSNLSCMAQETETGVLYQARGVGWGERWEDISKRRGYMYTYVSVLICCLRLS